MQIGSSPDNCFREMGILFSKNPINKSAFARHLPLHTSTINHLKIIFCTYKDAQNYIQKYHVQKNISNTLEGLRSTRGSLKVCPLTLIIAALSLIYIKCLSLSKTLLHSTDISSSAKQSHLCQVILQLSSLFVSCHSRNVLLKLKRPVFTLQCHQVLHLGRLCHFHPQEKISSSH